MKHLLLLREYLQKELVRLEKLLQKTKIARDNAPTFRESASDESRTRLEGEVAMLERMRQEKERLLETVPEELVDMGKVELWHCVETEVGRKKMKVVLVPKELGGVKIGQLQCISTSTPLGAKLLNKKSR